jgi:hypothetical protein
MVIVQLGTLRLREGHSIAHSHAFLSFPLHYKATIKVITGNGIPKVEGKISLEGPKTNKHWLTVRRGGPFSLS